MVASAGAGTSPIPHKLLTADKLSDAINFCLQPQTLAAVQEMSVRMSTEHGVQEAARSFHANLSPERISCDVLADRPAVWLYSKKKLNIKLSALAAHILIYKGKIKSRELTM